CAQSAIELPGAGEGAIYVNYPVVLVRLSRVHADAMRDLLAGAWRLVGATAKPRAKKARAMSASVGDARLHEALDASVRRIGSFDRNTSLSAARMALFIRRARTILRAATTGRTAGTTSSATGARSPGIGRGSRTCSTRCRRR